MIEREFVARAAELARKTIAQEYVEAGEGGLCRRLHISLERHHARQFHFETGTSHRAVILRDNVDALQEHGLDRVLPGPERERVVAERTKVGVEHERRPACRRHM